MQTPSTDTEWTTLSVTPEVRESISKQIAAGETYDEYLRENLSLVEE
jgi:hypothetical protein